MDKHSFPSDISSSQYKETHLLDYFMVFRRRWKVSLLFLLVVLAGASGYILTRTPIYAAYTTLNVVATPADMLQTTPFQDKGMDLRSDLRFIHSRSMAEKVASTLNLQVYAAESTAMFEMDRQGLALGEGVTMITLEMTSPTIFVVRDKTGRSLGTGRVGELFSSPEATLVITVAQAKAGDRLVLKRRTMAEGVALVRNHIHAWVVGNGGNVVQIKVENSDPFLARDIANAVATIYQQQSVLGKTRDATLMLEFIASQLDDLRGQVERSEKELQAFKIKSGLKNLSLEGEQAVDQVVALERQKGELILQRKRVELFLENADSSTRYFTSVEDIPGVREAQVASVELVAKREDLLENFTEAHPHVIAIDKQLDQLSQRVIRNCQLELLRIHERSKAIVSQLVDSDNSLEDIPQDQLELARMSRTNKVNSDLYMQLLQRQQQTEIALATTTSNIEVIDPAILSESPISPNRPKLFMIASLAGLLGGIGCTFLLDYFDQTIRDVEGVREYLDLPVLATIPRIDLAHQAAAGSVNQLALTLAPKSPAVEAFRALRTSLYFASTKGKGKGKGKVVMVTSAIPGEGKSTVSANVAGVFAQGGSEVLLIGCDLRRPSLASMFNMVEVPGLTEFLVEEKILLALLIGN